MQLDDPAFWRAGAISTVLVMSVVLIMLTIDTLAVMSRAARMFLCMQSTNISFAA